MRGPKITSPDSGLALEHLIARWPGRYALAVFSVAAVAMVALGMKGRIAADAYVLMLFAAMMLSGTVAGLGPGLVATALVLLAGWAIPVIDIATSRIEELAVEGVLVSLFGGAFRAARIKASQRLADKLRLEQQILEIGDEERRRIGHDLHDGLGQHLTGISLLSETIAQHLEAGGTPDPANVERITKLASEAVRLTRDLAKSLSPVTLERDGFLAAIEELADTTSGLLGINCRWEFDGKDLPLDRTRALHLFRIVQEAVNNSVRHGKARDVCIGFSRTNNEIKVTVTDDGSGLSSKTMNNPGLGLRIMQYRSRMLGASLTVERADATGGTVVTCMCPNEAGVTESHEHVSDRTFVARTQS